MLKCIFIDIQHVDMIREMAALYLYSWFYFQLLMVGCNVNVFIHNAIARDGLLIKESMRFIDPNLVLRNAH